MIAAELAALSAYVAALGASCLPRSWYRQVLAEAARSRGRAWCLIGFTVTGAGLLANYFLVLLLHHLLWGAVAGGIWMALRAGVALAERVHSARAAFALRVGSTPSPQRLQAALDGAGWIAALALAGALAVWTLALPIAEWDPKSIWFFHAKMIYHAQGLFADSGWSLHLLSFSQPDYPKLFPVLAAQAATLCGYWNEYLPKLSLVILQLATLMGVLALARSRVEAVLLVCGMVVFNAAAFTTGYVDAFLAVFATCAAVMLARAAHGGHEDLWLPGLIACALAPALKNEGSLLALIVLAVTLGVAWRREGSSFLLRAPALAAIAIPAFLPALWWIVLRGAWEIQGQLSFGGEFLARAGARLAESQLLAIVEELAKQGKVLSSGFIIAVAAVWLRRVPAATVACMAASMVYFTGLVLVYLGTPNPLPWHLTTSASRTALSIQMMLYAGVACALGEVARGAGERRIRRGAPLQ